MRKMGLRTTKLGYLKSVLQEIHFMTFIHLQWPKICYL